jgi:V/A-type H+-transporting ATPase subunit E
MNQVEELESAILARAERLAGEYRERAERSRDRILREAAEQLRLREEREVLVAKSLADRTYRRKVQSSELRLHAHMDHLRWNLVRGVEQRLKERMLAFIEREQEYDRVLQGYLAQGARLIERDELVAELNPHDQQRLEGRWEEFVRKTVPDKRIRLSPDTIDTLGGVLVRTADGRIRLDNTFEGRRERLRPQLYQIIVERLIPAAVDSAAMRGV